MCSLYIAVHPVRAYAALCLGYVKLGCLAFWTIVCAVAQHAPVHKRALRTHVFVTVLTMYPAAVPWLTLDTRQLLLLSVLYVLLTEPSQACMCCGLGLCNSAIDSVVTAAGLALCAVPEQRASRGWATLGSAPSLHMVLGLTGQVKQHYLQVGLCLTLMLGCNGAIHFFQGHWRHLYLPRQQLLVLAMRVLIQTHACRLFQISTNGYG